MWKGIENLEEKSQVQNLSTLKKHCVTEALGGTEDNIVWKNIVIESCVKSDSEEWVLNVISKLHEIGIPNQFILYFRLYESNKIHV